MVDNCYSTSVELLLCLRLSIEIYPSKLNMDTILLLLGNDICDMQEVSHDQIRSSSFFAIWRLLIADDMNTALSNQVNQWHEVCWINIERSSKVLQIHKEIQIEEIFNNQSFHLVVEKGKTSQKINKFLITVPCLLHSLTVSNCCDLITYSLEIYIYD